ncbi:retinaldehyde-binding protein 1, partial [Nephila pilipes]
IKPKTLIKEKDLPICTDDDFLLMFLRNKKFDIKRSFEQCSNYSYQRHAMMNYYGFMFADKIMAPLYHNICGILPYRDHEGNVIIYFRANQYNSSICEPDDVLRAVQAIGHFVLTFPATQICGLALIADLKVESLQVLQLLARYVKWALPSLHAFPARFRKIDCVNTHIFVRTMVNLFRSLAPVKLLKRTTFHDSDAKALLKSYDASLLPEEFGGTMGPLKDVSQFYLQKFEDFVPKLQASNFYYKRKNTIPFPES